jgi:phenylacetate-CoA ligase
MSQDDLLQRLQAVIAAAYAHAPATRRRFEAAGLTPADIRTVDDLSRLPVQSKDEAVALQRQDPPFGGLLAVPADQVRRIFLSPGPLYEPEAGDDRSVLNMAILALQRSGFEAGDVVLNTLSYHLVPAGSLVDQALVELGCTAIPGGIGNSDLQIMLLRDLSATGYTGTPSFLMQLLQKAEEMGLDPGRDLKLGKAMFTAEPLAPSARQTLTEKYGLTVGNAYATADLGFMAVDTTGQLGGMRLLPEPLIQVVDPETGLAVGPGEAGEVVVTNLSLTYPLIRYGTGDMAVNFDPAPGTSRQEDRAIVLVGRSGEAIKVRGMFVHPNQLRFAVGQVVAFSAVQGVVTRPEAKDFFTLRVALIEAGQAGQAELAEKLKEQIRAVCRVRVDEIEFVGPGAIDPGARGMVDARDWS